MKDKSEHPIYAIDELWGTSNGDWVEFKWVDGDYSELAQGVIRFPDEDDWKEGVGPEMVYILNHEVHGHGENDGFTPDGKAIHCDLVTDRLGNSRWKDEQDRIEAEEWERTKREGWELYRSR